MSVRDVRWVCAHQLTQVLMYQGCVRVCAVCACFYVIDFLLYQALTRTPGRVVGLNLLT